MWGGELLDLCVVPWVNGSSVLGPGVHPLVSCVHVLGRDVGLLFMSTCVYVTIARGQH